MSYAVRALCQQYLGAFEVLDEVLQREAMKRDYDPDVATRERRIKSLQRLVDGGAAVHALAELYDLIARSAGEAKSTSAEEDRGNLQARVEEFDAGLLAAGLPAFLTRDPAWNAALEKSRATAGLT
jgi:hypothetical protein